MNSDYFPDFPSLNRGEAPPDDVYVPPYVPVTAENLNLETEFLEQYNTAKKLLHVAEVDMSIGLNQKAQLLNSITSIMNSIVKGQAELYSMERIKIIESTLIRTLKKHPELQTAFMADYKEALDAV